MSCILPRITYEADFLALDDSVELINTFCGVVASRDSNDYTMHLPRESPTI